MTGLVGPRPGRGLLATLWWPVSLVVVVAVYVSLHRADWVNDLPTLLEPLVRVGLSVAVLCVAAALAPAGASQKQHA
ncbi:hypothetical protein ACQBAT_01480 [Ornithinimicrobium sp. Y1847]|uniref:hypothetical protein n=1 Tax=Ornithinimicrobium sp. Y1847 TaxID=3405419 RepID=UPI003B683AAB